MSSPIFTWAKEAYAEMRAEYAIVQEAEYARAEEATNGYMTTNDDYNSWSAFKQERYLTQELIEHLEQFPSTKADDFEQEWLDGRVL